MRNLFKKCSLLLAFVFQNVRFCLVFVKYV